MHSREITFLLFLSLTLYTSSLAQSSPFSIALHTLQDQIGYNFTNSGLVSLAMTHASFSAENNKALSILGESVIETSISLRLLTTNIDVSPKDLNRRLSDISNVDTCAIDGTKLRLENVIRVSPKTDSSTPSVVCGAFRAMFGAIAVDSGKADVGGTMFWKVREKFGGGLEM